MTDDVIGNGECATGRWLRAMADIEHDDAAEAHQQELEQQEIEDGNE